MKILDQVYKSSQFLIIISLLVFSLSFAQQIMIHHLKSIESIDCGITETISRPQYEPFLELSAFGWIRVNSPMLFGRIFDLETLPIQDNKMNDQAINTIFSLSISQWNSSQLIFSSQIDDTEQQSFVDLLPEEINSWVFVYLGQMVQQSRQTYFKYSPFDQQTITKNVKIQKEYECYKLIAGIGRYEGIQFFNGDIERLSIHMGNQAYKESDFQPLFVLHPESVETNALGFTECAYTGKSIDLCQSQLQTQVKSILLNDSQTADICVGSAQIRVLSNIECIEEPSLQGLRKYKDVKIVSLVKEECIQ